MKKNRRFAVLAFLLVAVIAVGVGFANFSETLTVNARVGAPGADVDFQNAVFKVNGTAISADDQTEKNHATIVDENMLTITITDALINTGDTATVTVDIVNSAAFDVLLTTTTTKDSLTNFSYSSTLADGTTELGAGDTLTVTMTIELTKVSDVSTSQNFYVTIAAAEIIGS